MERHLEPELMDDKEQAAVYARADFEDAHSRFIELFQEKVGDVSGRVLDLGCGPCDITVRFARAFSNSMIFGVDGSKPMLEEGQKRLEDEADIKGRIVLIHDILENLSLPQRSFDVIISNSLLHHLHKPTHLWNTLKMLASPNAWIFIMDLMRPESEKEAQTLVEAYSKDESDVLKKDFYNSLLAAFEAEEVKTQLQEAGLDHLQTEIVSDRHFIVYGRM